jgi:hypothetical protein
MFDFHFLKFIHYLFNYLGPKFVQE